MISLTCGMIRRIKRTNKTNRLINTENKLLVAMQRGGEGMGKTSEGDKEVQTYNYEINKSSAGNIVNTK